MIQRKRCEIGMCRRCGEAYIDSGTNAQRVAWLELHGAACKRPQDPMTADPIACEVALNALLALDPASPAN